MNEIMVVMILVGINAVLLGWMIDRTGHKFKDVLNEVSMLARDTDATWESVKTLGLQVRDCQVGVSELHKSVRALAEHSANRLGNLDYNLLRMHKDVEEVSKSQALNCHIMLTQIRDLTYLSTKHQDYQIAYVRWRETGGYEYKYLQLPGEAVSSIVGEINEAGGVVLSVVPFIEPPVEADHEPQPEPAETPVETNGLVIKL